MGEKILKRSGLGRRMKVSNEGMKKALTIFIAFAMVGSVLTIISQNAHSHSGDVIFSEWATASPVMDGSIVAGEWDDATMLDLMVVPGNALGVYMYVMNDATHLYMAYDATWDTSMDMWDGCTFCFDTDSASVIMCFVL